MRHIQQHYVSGNAAVIPPVERHRRDSLFPALVIHLDDKEIIPVFQQIAYFCLERSERALVLRHPLTIEPDLATLADTGEVQDMPAFGLADLEMPGIPDRAFIAPEFGFLGIPVPRDIEFESTVPGILQKLLLVGRSPVLPELFASTYIVLVYDSGPFTVKRYLLPSIRVGEQE